MGTNGKSCFATFTIVQNEFLSIQFPNKSDGLLGFVSVHLRTF